MVLFTKRIKNSLVNLNDQKVFHKYFTIMDINEIPYFLTQAFNRKYSSFKNDIKSYPNDFLLIKSSGSQLGDFFIEEQTFLIKCFNKFFKVLYKKSILVRSKDTIVIYGKEKHHLIYITELNDSEFINLFGGNK